MMRTLLLLLLLLTTPGCVAVDYLVDPVGCGTGTHEPIFPWYPHYLFYPPGTPGNEPGQQKTPPLPVAGSQPRVQSSAGPRRLDTESRASP